MAATSSTPSVQYHLSFKNVSGVFLVHEKKECPIEEIPDSFFDILKETGKRFVETASKGMVFDITFDAGALKWGPDVNKDVLKIFLIVLNTEGDNRAVYESMRSSGLTFSIHLETEVLGEGNKYEGMATASMRFPHLLHHLSQKYRRNSNPEFICIAGPGRKGDTSPIVAEMHMLFPEAKLTLLEKNKEGLQELWEVFHRKGVTYDCSQLLVHSKSRNIGAAILDVRFNSFFNKLLRGIGGSLENTTVLLEGAKDKIRPIWI